MSNTFAFTKMHGAGNDFVLIDDREERFPVDNHRSIASLANRHDGIGCDGVIIVRKPSGAAADFRMRFFNPDGTEADLCGNGARCVASFALAKGIAKAPAMRFETSAGDIDAEVCPDGSVKIAMPQPHDFGDDFVVAGVPHRIVPVENLAKTDVVAEGRAIRLDAQYAPDGTNVDFAVYRAPSRVHLRTYERGVEGETLACGTGAVAAAVIGVKDYGLEFPVKVSTAAGYELTIDGVFDGEAFSSIVLAGPVKTVFEGMFDFDGISAVAE